MGEVQRYEGIESITQVGAVVRPRILCADGFVVSVQASSAHYCTDAQGKRPAFTFSGTSPAVLPWTTVEVGFPSERPEPWDEWKHFQDGDGDPTEDVYAFVPVELVWDLIQAHGGMVGEVDADYSIES